MDGWLVIMEHWLPALYYLTLLDTGCIKGYLASKTSINAVRSTGQVDRLRALCLVLFACTGSGDVRLLCLATLISISSSALLMICH